MATKEIIGDLAWDAPNLVLFPPNGGRIIRTIESLLEALNLGNTKRIKITVEELEPDKPNLQTRLRSLNCQLGWDAANEIDRLRILLESHKLDPDRCGMFPKGEQCALKPGHSGGCKWANGD